MDDKPTLLTAAAAALLAGLMQVSVLILLAVRLRPIQIVAAYFVSMLCGGIVTTVLLVKLQLDPFLAGSIGVASGIAPAIIVPFVLLHFGLKKLGVDDQSVMDMVDNLIPRDLQGPHAPSPDSDPPMPEETPMEEVQDESANVR